MAPRTRTHARTHSAPRISIASSSSSVSEDTRPVRDEPRMRAGPVPRRVAIVGSGREALALSPLSAEEFRHNLSLAVCSSPELTIPSTYPPPNPNPGPVLRRIASEAPYKPSTPARTSRLPQMAPRAKGLPPPPRPQRRHRPPPVFVTTLGAPLALAEQSYSPFVTPRRSASVPPSAVSSSFWACSGPDSAESSDEQDLDVDGLDEMYGDYDFSDVEAEHGVKSALGGTYFPSTLEGGRYSPSPPPTIRSRVSSPLGARRPLRVQVSVECVAFRDETWAVHQHHLEDQDEVFLGRGMGVAQGLPDLEDGIKTRQPMEAVHGLGGQRATKVSLGKALGRWLKKRA